MDTSTTELFVKLLLTVAVAWLLTETHALESLVDYSRIKEGLRRSEYTLIFFIVIRTVAAFIEYYMDWSVGWFSIIGSMGFFMGLAITTRLSRQRFADDWKNARDLPSGQVFKEGITLAKETTEDLIKLK